MESVTEWLLSLDTVILVIIIVGGFIAWELKSGEIPMRLFGSIRRDARPFFYWMGILLHLAILAILVYSFMIGIRLPISELLN